jgi:hypothetical protein
MIGKQAECGQHRTVSVAAQFAWKQSNTHAAEAALASVVLPNLQLSAG